MLALALLSCEPRVYHGPVHSIWMCPSYEPGSYGITIVVGASTPLPDGGTSEDSVINPP
jgi:hypothetical protein